MLQDLPRVSPTRVHSLLPNELNPGERRFRGLMEAGDNLLDRHIRIAFALQYSPRRNRRIESWGVSESSMSRTRSKNDLGDVDHMASNFLHAPLVRGGTTPEQVIG